MEFAIFVVFMVVVAIVGAVNKQRGTNGAPSPRVQKLIERIQAQQGGDQPVQFQGQFTQPGPQQNQVSGSQQAGAALQALMQAGRQHAHPGEWATPGQAAAPQQFAPQQFAPPAPAVPAGALPAWSLSATGHVAADAPAAAAQLSAAWAAAEAEPGRPRARADEGRQRGRRGPAALGRAGSGHCSKPRLMHATWSHRRPLPSPARRTSNPVEEETRYVGSAAFAESIFNLDPEENTWASGWVDTPEPDDRSDIDELWQTVRNPPRPTGAQ